MAGDLHLTKGRRCKPATSGLAIVTYIAALEFYSTYPTRAATDFPLTNSTSWRVCVANRYFGRMGWRNADLPTVERRYYSRAVAAARKAGDMDRGQALESEWGRIGRDEEQAEVDTQLTAFREKVAEKYSHPDAGLERSAGLGIKCLLRHEI